MSRNLVQDLDHETLGSVKQVGPAVRFSGSRNEMRSGVPVLGADTAKVLKEILGENDGNLRELHKDGVIYNHDWRKF